MNAERLHSASLETLLCSTLDSQESLLALAGFKRWSKSCGDCTSTCCAPASDYIPLVVLMYLNQSLNGRISPSFQRAGIFYVSCYSFSLCSLFDKYNYSLAKLLQITKGKKLCLSLTTIETSSLISGGTQCSQMQLIDMNSTMDFVL